MSTPNKRPRDEGLSAGVSESSGARTKTSARRKLTELIEPSPGCSKDEPEPIPVEKDVCI